RPPSVRKTLPDHLPLETVISRRPVIDVARQRGPARCGVAEGAGETALAADLFHRRVEEGAQLGEDRRRLCATRGEALGWWFALNVGFDCKQPRDHVERVRRRGRFRFDM